MTAAIIVLTLLGVLAVVPTAATRFPRESWIPPAAQLLLLASAGALAPLSSPLTGFPRASALVLGMGAAAGGASPVVRAAFRLAGRGQPSVLRPPNVLRGGGVIGVLERASVAAAILAQWPAGIAVVLAIKGLARYPELRDAKVSEQFIIGTFTSVLWAAACSGVVVALLG